MKLWQSILLIVALLTGALALAQPPAGDPKPNKPDKPQPQAVTVTGTVKEIGAGEKGRAQFVRVQLDTKDGPTMIALGPVKYNDKIGLTLKAGDEVTVNGWKAPNAVKQLVMVRDLTVNGKTFNFRDEKAQPLWNPLEFLPQVTVSGTIKEIILPRHQPKPAAGEQPKPADQPKPTQPGIVLTTDKGDVCIEGVPPRAAEKLGLKLDVGAKISVTGWQMPQGKNEKVSTITAKTITLGDKTTTLRDDTGKPAWEKAQGGQHNRNGGQRKPHNPNPEIP